jgi:hypothetical protein
MKIDVKSTHRIDRYYLKDLQDRIIEFKMAEELQLPHGWYELNIEYTGNKNEFSEIVLNDIKLEEIIYTGYYVDGKGLTHQPATAVWDEGGCFKIWLHTEVGVLFERTIRCLRSGDYGKNLFDNYLLTVDKPFTIDNGYPNDIKSFFANGDGPNWWHKNSKLMPYKKIPVPDLDKSSIIKECNELCVHEKRHSKQGRPKQEYTVKSTHPDCVFDLPFAEFDDNRFPTIKKLLDHIGMSRPLSVGINTLMPGNYFHIHRDDGAYARKGYKYTKGCRIFYWLLTKPEQVYYKFGRCGLIPLETPLFINPTEHVHSVINQSQEPRLALNIAGEFVTDEMEDK